MRRTLLLLVLLLAPVWAQDSRADAERTAQLIDSLYQAAGPEIGCLLYDPCYVLTLGDLRPEGSWNGRPVKAEDDSSLDKLRKLGKLSGHRFLVEDDGGMRIRSLRGLALVSRECRLPGATEFAPTSGWEGWAQWFTELREGLKEAKVPEAGHHEMGVMLGYPDTAIKNYLRTMNTAVHHRRAIDADIERSDFLENGQPNFSLLPEDTMAADVVRTCDRWSTFLTLFYDLPEVKSRLRSKEFLAARERRKGRIHWSVNERWLRSQFQYFNLFERDTSGIGREQELILQDHIDELEQLVLSGAPPYEWSRACDRWRLEDGRRTRVERQTFLDWLWLGAFNYNPQRYRLYRAVTQVKPEFLEAILKRKIEEWQRSGQEKGAWHRRKTIILLEHPDFRIHYQKLTPKERQPYLDALNLYRDNAEVRRLLSAPPYLEQLEAD